MLYSQSYWVSKCVKSSTVPVDGHSIAKPKHDFDLRSSDRHELDSCWRGKTRIDRRHASIHHRFDQLTSLLGGTNRHVHRGRNASRWERGVDTRTYETPVPHGSRVLSVEAEGLVRVSPIFSILHSSVEVDVSIPICLRSAESSCSSWANFA